MRPNATKCDQMRPNALIRLSTIPSDQNSGLNVDVFRQQPKSQAEVSEDIKFFCNSRPLEMSDLFNV